MSASNHRSSIVGRVPIGQLASDVDYNLSGSATDGQVLAYSASERKWKATDVGGGGGGGGAINQIASLPADAALDAIDIAAGQSGDTVFTRRVAGTNGISLNQIAGQGVFINGNGLLAETKDAPTDTAAGAISLRAAREGQDAVIRKLKAGANVSITDAADGVEIAATGGGAGEANTTSNLGTGEGLAAPKAGVDLPFKSLVGGTNITLTSDATTLTIDAAGGGAGGLTNIVDAPTDAGGAALAAGAAGTDGYVRRLLPSAGRTFVVEEAAGVRVDAPITSTNGISIVGDPNGQIVSGAGLLAETADAASDAATSTAVSLRAPKVGQTATIRKLYGAGGRVFVSDQPGGVQIDVPLITVGPITQTTNPAGTQLSSTAFDTTTSFGAGESVFRGKTGNDLELKSIVGGRDVAVSATADEITVASSAPTFSAQTFSSGILQDVFEYDATSATPAAGKWVVIDTLNADAPITSQAAGGVPGLAVRMSKTNANGVASGFVQQLLSQAPYEDRAQVLSAVAANNDAGDAKSFFIEFSRTISDTGNVGNDTATDSGTFIEISSTPNRTAPGLSLLFRRLDNTPPPFAIENGKLYGFSFSESMTRLIDAKDLLAKNTNANGAVMVQRNDSANPERFILTRVVSSPRAVVAFDTNAVATPLTATAGGETQWAAIGGLAAWTTQYVNNEAGSNLFTVAGGAVSSVSDTTLPSRFELSYSIELFTTPPGLVCEAAVFAESAAQVPGSVSRVFSPTTSSSSEASSSRVCVAPQIAAGGAPVQWALFVRGVEGPPTSITVARATFCVKRLE